MADKKNDVFRWNFDLKDTDSEFTDIEYSPDAGAYRDGEDEGVKPFIFVDGSYKSDGDAASFVDQYVTENTPARPGRRDYSFRRDSDLIDETLGPDKRNDKPSFMDRLKDSFSNLHINWKFVLIGLAILAVVIILLIIIWPKKKEEKGWKLNENADITKLVENYFEAKKEGNATAMKLVLISEATVDSVALGLESKIYDRFDNIRIYTYPGKAEGENCMLVTTDVKFTNISTIVPKGYYFYARPDADKKLRLLTEAELTGLAAESETYDCLKKAVNDGDFVTKTAKKITDDAKAAYAKDSELEKYVAYWESGKYVIPEPAGSTTATQDPSSGTTSPTDPNSGTTAPITPPDTEHPENYVELDFCGYITEAGVRLRSTTSTEGSENVLMQFGSGHYLWIIGEVDGWYHVRDIRDDNGRGGSQTPSGREGYVKKDFISPYYSDVKSD